MLRSIFVFIAIFMADIAFAQNFVCDTTAVAKGYPYKVGFFGTQLTLTNHDVAGSDTGTLSVAPGYKLVLRPEKNQAAVYFNDQLHIILQKSSDQLYGSKTAYSATLTLNNNPDSFNHQFHYQIDQIRLDQKTKQMSARFTILINTPIPQDDGTRKTTQFSNTMKCRTNGK